MTFGIIVKNYEHYNKALPKWHCSKGRYISSKADYERACRDAGLIPFEKANYKESTPVKPQHKEETVKFLKSIQDKTDRKGNVKLSDREISYMIEKGIIKDRDKVKIPDNLPMKGGFHAVKEGHIRKSY